MGWAIKTTSATLSQKHDQAGSMKVDITPDNDSGTSEEDVIDDLIDDLIIPEIPLLATTNLSLL